MLFDVRPHPPSSRCSRTRAHRPIKVTRKGKLTSKPKEQEPDEPAAVVWRFIKDEPVRLKTAPETPADVSCVAEGSYFNKQLPCIPGGVYPDQKSASYSHHLRCASGRIELNNVVSNPLPKIVALAASSPKRAGSASKTIPDPDAEHSLVLPPRFGNLGIEDSGKLTRANSSTAVAKPPPLSLSDLPGSLSDELRQLVLVSGESDQKTLIQCAASYEADHPTTPSWMKAKAKQQSLFHKMEKRGGFRGLITTRCTAVAPVCVLVIVVLASRATDVRKSVRFAKGNQFTTAASIKNRTVPERKQSFRQLIENEQPATHRTDEIGKKMKTIFEGLQTYWKERCGDPTSVITDVDPFDILVDMKREHTKRHPLSNIKLTSSCPEELQYLASTVISPSGLTYTVPVINGDTSSAILGETTAPSTRPRKPKKDLPHKRRFKYSTWYIHPSKWADSLKSKKTTAPAPPLQSIANRAEAVCRQQADTNPAVTIDIDSLAVEELNPLGSFSYMTDTHKEHVNRLQEQQREAEEHFKRRGLYKQR